MTKESHNSREMVDPKKQSELQAFVSEGSVLLLWRNIPQLKLSPNTYATSANNE